MKSRRACREAALQVLYQCDVLADFSEQSVAFFFEHFTSHDDLGEQERPENLSSYGQELVTGIIAHMSEIDARIAMASTHWSVARMPCVDRNIIRIAVYEMRFSDDVPAKVCINEAIEIAKRFSGDEAPKFINGVLDTIATFPKNESSSGS
jgi:N utilization substance protein B